MARLISFMNQSSFHISLPSFGPMKRFDLPASSLSILGWQQMLANKSFSTIRQRKPSRGYEYHYESC